MAVTRDNVIVTEDMESTLYDLDVTITPSTDGESTIEYPEDREDEVDDYLNN